MAKKGEIVAAVDFGSRDVRVLIAQQGHDGAIHILGHGIAAAQGCVSQGVIQDLQAAQQALKRALTQAEKEAGVKPISLFCGLNGKNVESTIREGQVDLEKDEVERHHMVAALDEASKDIQCAGKRVLSSVSSQEWYVDDLRVNYPVGIRGKRLKTRVHFALMPTVIEDNIYNCIESLNRDLEDVVFLPIAAALGCLTPEDMDLGVAVLDMGRTNTGVSVYRDHRLLATHIFEFGGFHITRDVAAGLQVSFEEAVDLIMEYGISNRLIYLEMEDDEEDETSQSSDDDVPNTHIKLKTVVRGVPGIVDRSVLDEIVFERSKELFTKIRNYLHTRGYARNLVRGVVLTGGAANIRHMPSLAQAVFQVPVRVGLPTGIDHITSIVASAEFAPAVGILRHGFTYRAALRSGLIEQHRGPFATIFKSVSGTVSKYFF